MDNAEEGSSIQKDKQSTSSCLICFDEFRGLEPSREPTVLSCVWKLQTPVPIAQRLVQFLIKNRRSELDRARLQSKIEESYYCSACISQLEEIYSTLEQLNQLKKKLENARVKVVGQIQRSYRIVESSISNQKETEEEDWEREQQLWRRDIISSIEEQEINESSQSSPSIGFVTPRGGAPHISSTLNRVNIKTERKSPPPQEDSEFTIQSIASLSDQDSNSGFRRSARRSVSKLAKALDIKKSTKDHVKKSLTKKRSGGLRAHHKKKSKKNGKSTSKIIPSTKVEATISNSMDDDNMEWNDDLPNPENALAGTKLTKTTSKTSKVKPTAPEPYTADNQPCYICCKSFQPNDMVHHFKAKHPDLDYGRKLCSICHKPSNDLHYHHATTHWQTFNCKLCNENFTRFNEFNYHLTTHPELGLSPVKCQQCSRLFMQNKNLLGHIKAVHLHQHPFRCELCPYGGRSQKYLDEHIKVTHLKIKEFTCEICNQGFSNDYYLRQHLKRHKGEKNLECDLCSKKFIDTGKLKDHKAAVHGGECKHICEVCGKAFPVYNYLYIHMRSHETTEQKEARRLKAKAAREARQKGNATILVATGRPKVKQPSSTNETKTDVAIDAGSERSIQDVQAVATKVVLANIPLIVPIEQSRSGNNE